MEAAGYPRFKAHHAIHEDMRMEVNALVDGYQHDSKAISMNVMDYLVSWLFDHINENDRLFAGYLRRKAQTRL
jgi:hemerythrin-like metal-binding protein